MPVMNGLDLAKEVNELRPHIKIIIFSAYGEFEYAKQALEANAVINLSDPQCTYSYFIILESYFLFFTFFYLSKHYNTCFF